ncbi:MAG: beta-propeller fold lactonase family protein [Terracidiphilus sp.]|nr:beta-propeller fold lactonase family protein [Terracidiphilus sp.]
MRVRIWTRIVPGVALGVAVLTLAGCKGFWNEPASSSTTTTTKTSGHVYVLNAGANAIAGYYVNAGTLTALSGSPYSVPATPLALAVAPDNDFLYVSTVSGIYVYTIASTGALTISNSSTAITSDPATSMAISSGSNWLVEAVSGSASVFALAVNPTTGLLRSTAEQSQTLPASTIQQVTMAPDDSYAIVSMGTGGTALIPFTTGNTNPFGAVTTIGTVNSSGSALSAAVDPSARVLYIGETAATSGTNSGGIRVFNLSTLVEQSGSPYASGGLAPYWILPEAGGSYVYAVNRQTSSGSTGVLNGFTLSQSSNVYKLNAMSSTFTAGTHPVAAVEDNTAQFVFVVNYGGSYDLMGYVFDSSTAGALDEVVYSSTGTDPVYANAIAAAH